MNIHLTGMPKFEYLSRVEQEEKLKAFSTIASVKPAIHQ
jgi:hypothetical protein